MVPSHRMLRRAARTAVVVGALTAAGFAVAPVAASATTSPTTVRGRAIEAQLAVNALVRGGPADARSALPPRFSDHFGYHPATTNGLLGDPGGECSSPVSLPEEFLAACRQHDLAYDLLRDAARAGAALPPTARQAADERLGIELEASCEGRRGAHDRSTCLVWADVVEGFVRANSVRQGDGVPGGETPASIAPAAGLGVAGLGALALVVSSSRSRRSCIRSSSRPAWCATRVPPLRPPSASTVLAAPPALLVATFPSYLPQQPLAFGLLSALSWLVVHGIAGRVASRLPSLTGAAHRAALVLAGILTLSVGLAALTTQNAMRAGIGMVPVSAADVALAAATTGGLLGVVGGIRWLWSRRAAVSHRPLAVVVALVAATSAPGPANAAEPVPAHVLSAPSPVGAARAYAGLSDAADDGARARVAVDRLVAARGFDREHLVVAIPTGSGWVNPDFVAGTERRFGAEVATVSMQYDDRPSWLAFLLGRRDAVDGARALLDAVAAEVARLPVEQRPQVHVVGESLGATAGQAALTAPDAGALRSVVCSTFWVGTPGGGGTGRPRETLAANADDPIVHARLSMAFWPSGDGRPWLPLVSAVHAGADVIGALAVPVGSGHRYGPDQPDRLRTCD
ncbi:MAG: alpha/beta-hydrolase family protein [Dermatophilaceae bacterium]